MDRHPSGRKQVCKSTSRYKGWERAVRLAILNLDESSISQDASHKVRSLILGDLSVCTGVGRSGLGTQGSWVCQLGATGGSPAQSRSLDQRATQAQTSTKVVRDLSPHHTAVLARRESVEGAQHKPLHGKAQGRSYHCYGHCPETLPRHCSVCSAEARRPQLLKQGDGT